MVNAGRVAIVPQGEWSADSTYKRLDAVTHNNTLYFAKKEVPAGTETTNTEYWSKSIAGGQSEITVDGTTITLDEAKGIISLAKTLQDKIKTIDNKLPKTSVVNTNTTTEAGFALDARQANPNIEGTMAANILQLNNDLNGSLKIKDIPWTPYCPRTNFADKVKFKEENAMQYGSLMICSIRIELLENTPGEYVYIVNLPQKMFRGINQTNMDGKTGLWYLDAVNECVVLRSIFEAGIYYFSFMYLTTE